MVSGLRLLSDSKLIADKEKESVRDWPYTKRMMPKSGETVIIVLQNPRERLLGILDAIEPAGVFVRSVDLSYFDDWCRSIVSGEPYLPMNDCFLPMWRIERIVRDEGVPESPSMAELFEQRTGRSLGEF